jgi:hypothetical protein
MAFLGINCMFLGGNMGPAEKLLQQYANKGHPWARVVEPEEVPALIEALRERLHATSKELDLSPPSLKRLEQRLVDMYQSMKAQEKTLMHEDLVQLIRQVTAYIGEVLVKHAQGRWDKGSQTLWGTGIVIEGPWDVTKGQRYNSPYPTHFIVGSEAASAWDVITEGGKPRLDRIYREARTKRIRERSSRNK